MSAIYPIYSLKGENGSLYVYENRVEIKRDVFGSMSQGNANDKSIPLDLIVDVEFKEGTMFKNGYIRFGVIGEKEAKSGVLNATQDENTVMIKKADNEDSRKIAKYIEGILIKRKNAKPAAQQVSVADEIIKFKELLDAGVITQEEFIVKKRELLRM